MKHGLTIQKHSALALLVLVGSLFTKPGDCISSIIGLAPPHADRPDVVLSRINQVHKGSDDQNSGSSTSTSREHHQTHVDRRLLQFKTKIKTKGWEEKQELTKMNSNKTTKNSKGQKDVKSKGIQKKKTTNKVQQKKKKQPKTSKIKDANEQKTLKGNNNELKGNNEKTSNGESEKKTMMSDVQKKTKKNDDKDKNDANETDKKDGEEIDEDDDEADPTSSPTLVPTLSPTLEPTPSPTLALPTSNDDSNNSILDENDNAVDNDTTSFDKSASRRSPRYTPELCLASQKDSYRTCYQRHIDPSLSSSTIKCDSITNRKEYTPFTKPYITSEEELITGTVVLTMLLSDDDTTTTTSSLEDDTVLLNCRESFKLEETVLTYLSDNIGSENTFTPVCVYLEKYAYSSSSSKEVGGGRTLALEFEVTYIHNKKRPSSRNDNRRMLGYDEKMHALKLELGTTVGLDLSKVSTTEETINRELRKKTKQKIANGKKIGKRQKKTMSDIQTKDEKFDDSIEAVENDDEAEDNDEVVPTLMPTTAEEDTVEVEEVDEEYTNAKECTAIQTALCCSQLAINAASPPPGRGGTRAGIYCDSLDCSFRKQCGTGRMLSEQQVSVADRELQVKRDDVDSNGKDETTTTISGGGGRKDCLPYYFPTADPTWFDNYKGRGVDNICPAYGMLQAQDFNEAIRCITKIKVQDRSNYADAFHGSRLLETRIKSAPVYAQLNVRSLENAAYCSLNRYRLQQQGKPILLCEEFINKYECQVSQGNKNLFGTNDDLLPYVDMITEDGVVCLVDKTSPVPTTSSTLLPTLSPTLFPNTNPTESPTLSPSLMPTLSPTLTPTLSPETTRVKPLKKPSKKPTKKPSNKPTTATPSSTKPITASPSSAKPTTASPSSTKPTAATAAPSKAISTAAPSKAAATAAPSKAISTAAPSKAAATAKPISTTAPSKVASPTANPTATTAPSKTTDTKKPTSTASPSKAAETLKPTTLPSKAATETLKPTASPSKATETLKPTTATTSSLSNGTATAKPNSSPANSTSPLSMM